jgi:uncharacterized membrane protein
MRPPMSCPVEPAAAIEGEHSRRALLTGAVVLALTLTASASNVAADLKLCNQTSSTIEVAIGYRDAKGWASEGWFRVAPRSCPILLKGAVPSRFVYVHAVDTDRGGEWSGRTYMCTSDKSFWIRDVKDCQQRGYKRTGFYEVDTKAEADWTIQLSDAEDGGARQQ